MNVKEKARRIVKVLDKLYPDPSIPLVHKDPYTLLIAVLLSARCTDARVNLVTPKLFSLASSPETMVKLSVEQIQEVIRPCGLSLRKAQAIRSLSEQLLLEYEGKVPTTFEALEALPGVGHKTASVVMAQAFHHPAFPVDTHIYRCARRWGLSSGKSVDKVEKDLKEIFPKSRWIKLHLQIIHFARAHCQAIKHIPSQCPICSWIEPF